jgi:hypothetical protein
MPTCAFCNDLNLRAVNYVQAPISLRDFGGTLRQVRESTLHGCCTCSIVYEAVAHFAKLFNRTDEQLIRIKDASPIYGPASLAVEFNGFDRFEINLEFYRVEGRH